MQRAEFSQWRLVQLMSLCLLTLSPSSVSPLRLCVNRLSVWPQHHLEHADVPAEHPTGHLLHPHPGLPHLRLRPSRQLQLHQHWPQHRHSQRHHRSVEFRRLSCSHSLGHPTFWTPVVFLFSSVLLVPGLSSLHCSSISLPAQRAWESSAYFLCEKYICFQKCTTCFLSEWHSESIMAL